MNEIADAVLRLREAFRANGLSEPAIALGSKDDLATIQRLMTEYGAVYPSPRSSETKICDMTILPPGWIYEPSAT